MTFKSVNNLEKFTLYNLFATYYENYVFFNDKDPRGLTKLLLCLNVIINLMHTHKFHQNHHSNFD